MEALLFKRAFLYYYVYRNFFDFSTNLPPYLTTL